MMFLAELNDEMAAEALFRLSREKQMRPNDFSMAAAKEGRLFCLAVARSFVVGTAPFETQTSLQRFSTRMAEVLKNQIQF
jgi:hypothetical protein